MGRPRVLLFTLTFSAMDEAEVVAITGHAALLQALGQAAADQGFLAAVHLDARLAMDEAWRFQLRSATPLVDIQ